MEKKVNEITINYEGYEVVSVKRIDRSSQMVTIEITLEPIEDPE